jgi:DNA-binding CsgD family transcriptional regulator
MDGLDLHSIADAVHRSDTPQMAWAAFSAVLRRHGLSRTALHVGLPRRAANPFADHPGALAFGEVWDTALDAQLRGHAGDVRQATAPELWHLRPTLTFLSVFRAPLIIDHRAVLERPGDTPFAPISRVMLEELGQHQALSIPLADPSTGRLSILTIWGDEPGPAFVRFAKAHSAALQMAGLYFIGMLALRWPHATTGPPAPALSTRERQILSALAEGARVSGIADTLCVTERSVQEYITRARTKLGARTRTEAVASALLLGLIDPGPRNGSP